MPTPKPTTGPAASSAKPRRGQPPTGDLDDLIGAPLTQEVDDPEQPDEETGADAPDIGSPFVLVRPRVGRLTRTAIAFLALCHLLLVAAVPSGVAFTTNLANGDWALWFFVAIRGRRRCTSAPR
jgi:hypothetical protein